MKDVIPPRNTAILVLCCFILFTSCHKEQQSASACTDLMVQYFDPPLTISVPCDDMDAPSIIAVDSIDVNEDGVADLKVSYSSHVEWPGGGGAYWTCYTNGWVNGIDSTKIVYRAACHIACQGPMNPIDTVRPDAPTTLSATLHWRFEYLCNCYSSPGSIGFIKQINGHAYCGYLVVSDTEDEIKVIRTVIGNCPDEPVVISE